MTHGFPADGDAWIREYGELLGESDDYAEASEGWGVGFDGDFLFVVELDDVYDGEVTYSFDGVTDERVGGKCCGFPEWVVDDPQPGTWTVRVENK